MHGGAIMRRNIVVLLVFLVLTACGPSTQETPVLTLKNEAENALTSQPSEVHTQVLLGTVTPINQPTSTQTALSAATATDLPTLTSMPTSTATQFPIPTGLLTHQELEQRINDWINSVIEFSDTDRILDEKTGEELKLGLLVKQPIDMVIFVFYNLGFTVIEDQEGVPYLINVVGFEDRQGTRFTSVFHCGRLLDQDTTIRLMKWQGRRINHETKISSETFFPEEFAGISTDLPLSVYTGTTYTDGSTGDDATNKYLVHAKNATKALTEFFICEECLVEDMPLLLKPLINDIPAEYNPNIPYLSDYHISYW